MKPFASLGLFLTLAMSVSLQAQTTPINDGTSAANLRLIANVNGTFGSTTSLSTNAGGSLTAAQNGTAFFAMRNAWYATNAFPTGGVYTVSADFLPAIDPSLNFGYNRGGVMGWLNLSASNGIVLEVDPEDPPTFQISTVYFAATTGSSNENFSHVFTTNGAPLTGATGSGVYAANAGYSPTNFATFQLSFSAPTTAETTSLAQATAHISAKVFQLSNSVPVQVAPPIELLTDLPVPSASDHRIGYFAYWGSVNPIFPGDIIGYLDNLTASNVVTVVEPSAPPSLTIVLSAGNVQVSWPADYVSYQLRTSTTLAANSWTTVATVNNLYTTSVTGPTRFFQLIKP
jgi:hypothetical protein